MMRTTLTAALLACTGLVGLPALAADQIEIKYTSVSAPSDLHTKAMGVFKETLEGSMPGEFDVQLYDSGSLFKQGADVDALQRGNAEMTYLSFQTIAESIPAYGLMTAGYLFQSPEHYRAFFDSDIGQEFRSTVQDEMGLVPLDVCYLGTRVLNLRSKRDVQTPADLDGVKLRMPGSDAWLFLGQALGANPTPLPFGEVYLALQTGTIDAQDNPLPTVEAAKFYEVTEQLVLTNHLVDGIMPTINSQTWDALSDGQKEAVTAAAVESCNFNNEGRVKEEERLVDFFTSEGLTVSEPDLDAFRTHVQTFYAESDRSTEWPEGWVEKINALAAE